MPQMTKDSVHVGQKVGVDPMAGDFPGVWTVEKINPARAVLSQPGTRGLRCNYWMLTDPPAEQPAPPAGAPAPVGQPYQPVTFFDLGAIVATPNPKFPGLWVVIADKGERVNCAPLGGDPARPDRYLRANRAGLTKVTPAEAAAWLAGRS